MRNSLYKNTNKLITFKHQLIQGIKNWQGF
jgi:hypothetical protein